MAPSLSRMFSVLGHVLSEAWKSKTNNRLRRVPLYNQVEMMESETVRTANNANGTWLCAVPLMKKRGTCQNAEITPIANAAPSMPGFDCTRCSRKPRQPNSSPGGPPMRKTIRNVDGTASQREGEVRSGKVPPFRTWMDSTVIRMANGASTAAAYHWMPTRQRNACPMKSRSPRQPEVRETMATAASKGPKVPISTSSDEES